MINSKYFCKQLFIKKQMCIYDFMMSVFNQCFC